MLPHHSAARPNLRQSKSAYTATAIGLVLLSLGLSGSLIGIVQQPSFPVNPAPNTGTTVYVNGTLNSGKVLGTHYANPFYEVVLTDALFTTKALRSLGSYLNSTPVALVRFGGTGEGYNPTTQINYLPPSSGSGSYVATAQQLWNYTWFKAWCLSKTPHCAWLGYLPGEENDTKAAVHFAKWFHSVLGLAPTYWEFGNEPTQWRHFGKNFSTWSTADALQPSAIGYATMVHNYITAVRAVFPNDQFIGLEASCACNKQFAAYTAKVDGSLITSLAYHSYPSSSTSSTLLTGFYGLLSSSANISSSSARFRSGVTLYCTTCTNLPVELGEYQAGPFSSFSPFSVQFAGAAFFGASVVQAMQSNLTSLAAYNTNSLYNVTLNTPTYEGMFYQRILTNMTMGTDYGVTVSATGIGGVFQVLIQNGSRESLLVINTNSTIGLTLHVSSTVFPTGVAGSDWIWTTGSTAPTTKTFTALPKSYSIAPQGILLVTNY